MIVVVVCLVAFVVAVRGEVLLCTRDNFCLNAPSSLVARVDDRVELFHLNIPLELAEKKIQYISTISDQVGTLFYIPSCLSPEARDANRGSDFEGFCWSNSVAHQSSLGLLVAVTVIAVASLLLNVWMLRMLRTFGMAHARRGDAVLASNPN